MCGDGVNSGRTGVLNEPDYFILTFTDSEILGLASSGSGKGSRGPLLQRLLSPKEEDPRPNLWTSFVPCVGTTGRSL